MIYYSSFYFSGVQYDRTSPGFKALARIATLCNRAEFKGGQVGVPILKKYVIMNLFNLFVFNIFVMLHIEQ